MNKFFKNVALAIILATISSGVYAMSDKGEPNEVDFKCESCGDHWIEMGYEDHKSKRTCNNCGSTICGICNDTWANINVFLAINNNVPISIELWDCGNKTLPSSINYTSKLTSEEINKISKYQSATPASEPEWKWYRIGEKIYFLEDSLLWRYAKEEPEKGWHFVFPPLCSYCSNVRERGLCLFKIHRN